MKRCKWCMSAGVVNAVLAAVNLFSAGSAFERSAFGLMAFALIASWLGTFAAFLMFWAASSRRHTR